jgi:hypothetical protein
MTVMTGPLKRRKSSTYCSRLGCGYCHSARFWVRVNPKRWVLLLNLWVRTVQVACPSFHVGSSKERYVDFQGGRQCKRSILLSSGHNSKQYPVVFGLEVYRDLELQDGTSWSATIRASCHFSFLFSFSRKSPL